MTPELHDRVLTRLDTDAGDQPWGLCVVAALDGQERLDGYLDDATPVCRPKPSATAGTNERVEPPGVYVAAITVEGFRGIGAPATIPFHPGPGLTLIVGRNGSGKSSFAEGLEFLLTGRNYRWEKRAKAWVEGWRNLHHPQVSLKAELLVEGRGLVTVVRTWTGEALGANEAMVHRAGSSPQPLASLGWTEPLVTFRPFLSYNELGSLLEEGPSKLYDALSSVLGLEELVAVQTILTNARKDRQNRIENAREQATALKDTIEAAAAQESDQRLKTAAVALTWPAWDLPALKGLLGGDTGDASFDLAVLRQLQSLATPDTHSVADLVTRLRAADRACDEFAGTNAEQSRERAQLLQEALAFHAKHRGAECPVCGTDKVLTERWRASTERAIKALRKEASACEAVETRRKDTVRDALRVVTAPPPLLAQAVPLGLKTLAAARRQWSAWAHARDLESAAALADHLEAHVLEFSEAVEALKEHAEAEARRREDVWRPIASEIGEWLPAARSALRAHARMGELKAAESWWKEASGSIRDERFAPIASRALKVWNELRLQSSVNLGNIGLEGTAQRRRVTLAVNVDGTPAEALGVMSQGELHSLALSLFLPRATLPESPFRFIAIDDPVQSMDPARVEGLARVLADAATTRQVLVFTHDDRLPEAARRLGIAATVFGVTRRADSVVEVRKTTDPITGHIEDARALALTQELPPEVAGRVVPGFCRAALEAACIDVTRRRRLRRGELHEDVEQLITKNPKVYPLMALALFDDPQKTNEVLPRLKRKGQWAVDAFKACQAGAHEAHEGDLRNLIDASHKLATAVAAEEA
jgi:energy-coupling factor transporter ATP-binding protein EcfA2